MQPVLRTLPSARFDALVASEPERDPCCSDTSPCSALDPDRPENLWFCVEFVPHLREKPHTGRSRRRSARGSLPDTKPSLRLRLGSSRSRSWHHYRLCQKKCIPLDVGVTVATSRVSARSCTPNRDSIHRQTDRLWKNFGMASPSRGFSIGMRDKALPDVPTWSSPTVLIKPPNLGSTGSAIVCKHYRFFVLADSLKKEARIRGSCHTPCPELAVVLIPGDQQKPRKLIK